MIKKVGGLLLFFTFLLAAFGLGTGSSPIVEACNISGPECSCEDSTVGIECGLKVNTLCLKWDCAWIADLPVVE